MLAHLGMCPEIMLNHRRQAGSMHIRMHISSRIIIMRITSVIIIGPQGHSRVVDRGQDGELVDYQVAMCADDVVLKVTGHATVHRCKHSQLERWLMALGSKQMA